MIPEIKTLQRDLKLGQISETHSITVSKKGLPSNSYFWWKKRKIIKEFLKRGYVLSGSRALNCYRVNGKSILNRIPRDWDFLITREQFIDICKENKIYDFDFNAKSYTIKNHFSVIHNSYGDDTILVPTEIELFIKDTMPEFIEHEGMRLATLDGIIDCKLDLIDKKISPEKHRMDLNNIYVNINSNV